MRFGLDKMSHQLISVIIPVWRGRRYLPDCLSALFSQTDVDFEVIAVDNASSDGSAHWLMEQYPQVQVICNPANLGFAGACNIGIGRARGEVLLLLNQDTRMKPGCLHALNQALADSTIGIAGCKILYPDGKTIQHAGGKIDWPHGFTRHYGQGEIDDGTWDVARPVEYVTGAALAFRRDLISRIGVLDEGFWPGYFEDTDFCLRARDAGYAVWYFPSAVLIHYESSSISNPATISRFGHRGRLRFILKHLRPEQFLDQFVPAEEFHQIDTIRAGYGMALRMAYLETMTSVDLILRERWQADRETIYRIISALRYLYQSAWNIERDFTRSQQTVPPQADSRQSWLPPEELPRLALSPFQASMLQSRFSLLRRLQVCLYRWIVQPAMEHLLQQQQALNQNYLSHLSDIGEKLRSMSYSVHCLEDRLADLASSDAIQASSIESVGKHLTEIADANAALAAEIARLTLGVADKQPMPYCDFDLKRDADQSKPTQ